MSSRGRSAGCERVGQQRGRHMTYSATALAQLLENTTEFTSVLLNLGSAVIETVTFAATLG